jgi:hypothetical protein
MNERVVDPTRQGGSGNAAPKRLVAGSSRLTVDEALVYRDIISWRYYKSHGDQAVCALAAEVERLRANQNAFIDAARRHIASFEPGTLVGSELNLAMHLHAIDGDVWAAWIVPGSVEADDGK